MKKPVKETIHAKGIAIGIYTTDFEKYIKNNNEKILPNFGKLTLSQIPFTSNDKQEKNSNLGNIMLGIGTFAGIIGLGFLSMKKPFKK